MNIPYSFVCCLLDKCPLHKDCLRYLAAQNVDASKQTFNCLNPRVESVGTQDCPHFRSTEKVRYAIGLANVFNNVPGQYIKALRNQLISSFGQTRYYTEMRSGKRKITPKEQDEIAAIFKSLKIKAPVIYDRFEEDYHWS